MKLIIKDGLMYMNHVNKGNVLGCCPADRIAKSNGFIYAEQFTKTYNNQTLELDYNGKIIVEAEVLLENQPLKEMTVDELKVVKKYFEEKVLEPQNNNSSADLSYWLDMIDSCSREMMRFPIN